MKRSPGPRRTANLSGSIHRRLNMYALAASAAGVGILALAPPAGAKIVYTPAHKKIIFDAHFDHVIFFDLNHDGRKEFELGGHQSGFPTSNFSAWLIASARGQGNAIWTVESDNNPCAAALPSGKSVGPKGQFTTGGFMFFVTGGSFSICPWRGLKKPAYLGLKVAIKGKTHYGWARLSVQPPGHGSKLAKGILTGYAYETIPNKPIVTGRTKEAARTIRPTRILGLVLP
jgi:hypothetical protein